MTSTEIIGGTHAVLECLRAGRRRCREIWVARGRKEKSIAEIQDLARRQKIPIHIVTNEELGAISSLEKHQGILARTDSFPFTPLEEIIKKAKSDERKGLILILDGIMDPHNLGSLIRSAYLLGVHGVIVPKDNSAPVSPSAVKASAGSTEYIPIAQVTNITSTINILKKEDFWIVGAEGTSAQNLYNFDFTGNNYALVLGAEGKGVRRLVKENCDHLLSIPMLGNIDSFNVSVAGAILMAEIMRQRCFKGS